MENFMVLRDRLYATRINFLELVPEEVVRKNKKDDEEEITKNLLPNFSMNDLLRFRRVSKRARFLADDYMCLRNIRSTRGISVKLRHIVPMGSTDYESFENTKDLNWRGSADLRVGGEVSKLVTMKESEVPGTLAYMLKLDHLAAASKVHLNACCVTDLWKNPQIPDFLENYSTQISYLRLNKLELPFNDLYREGIRFLEHFRNLECLEIEELWSPEGKFLIRPNWEYVPSNLTNLKELRIQRYSTIPPTPRLSSGTLASEYYRRYLSFVTGCCSNGKMKYLNIPSQIQIIIQSSTGKNEIETIFMNEQFLIGMSRILGTVLKKFPGQSILKNLKVDLQKFWFQRPSATGFNKFLEFGINCKNFQIKLLNFDQTIVRCLQRVGNNDARLVSCLNSILNNCVVSLRNVRESQFNLILPFLEKIVITRTSLCSARGQFENGMRPAWSKLKIIHLTVDSDWLDNERGGRPDDKVNIFALFRFLFLGIRRESLTELKVKFEASTNDGIVFDGVPLVRPSVETVIVACPNLKILAIHNWADRTLELSRVWNHLLKLEELELGNIPTLSIIAFDPNLRNLRGLRKFTLHSIDKMPKLDDRIFKRVLRHMMLRELHLTSDEPIENLTMTGIEGLLTGPFVLTIEKFPLAGCLKLKDVTDNEMHILERKFRSFKMI